MRRSLVSAVFSLAALFASSAYAQAVPDGSADSLVTVANGTIAYCSLTASSDQQKAELEESTSKLMGRPVSPSSASGETTKCIESAKARLGTFYKAFVARHEKNPQALQSGRQYLAAALTALEGVVPTGGERKFQYEVRQRANKQKLAELESLLRVDTL